MEITHKIKMDLSQRNIAPRIAMVQGDAFTRRLAIALLVDKRPWKVPADSTVVIRYRKPNGEQGAYDTLPDGRSATEVWGNLIHILVAPEAVSHPGTTELMVSILRGGRQLSTFCVELAVQAMLASDQSPAGTAWLSAFLPAPENATPGQFFTVDRVDDQGRILSLKATDAPTDDPDAVRNAVNAYLASLDLSGGGISVTHAWNGSVLTITSASGTSSADLKGEKGEKGDKGDKGETGSQGDPGKNGSNGKSAFAYAQDAGFKGSEAEFAQRLAIQPVQTVNGIAPDASGNVALQLEQEELLEIAVFSEQELSFVSSSNGYGHSFATAPFQPVAGAVYKVLWSGETYTCTATDSVYNGIILLGDLTSVGGSGNGEPFMIGYMPASNQMEIISLQGSGDISVAVFHVTTQPQLPPVTVDHNGMLLQVVDGVWTAVAVSDSVVANYVDNYLGEALGGDY